ncbi:glycoside hydrolase superfamily [Chytriomyces sp. MP71]|nr:glycoside hydrolase superfamily [Chytriomyces sp. MP71]
MNSEAEGTTQPPTYQEKAGWGGRSKKQKTILVAASAILIITIAAIVAGIVISKNNSAASSASASSNSSNGVGARPTPALTASGGASGATNSTNTTIPAAGTNPWGGKRALIGYWGQDAIGNGYTPQFAGKLLTANLSTYCDQGIYQQLNLAFMPTFGSYPRFSLSFGGNESAGVCNWVQGSDGTAPPEDVQAPCIAMGAEIKHCQTKGVKVVLSMAGDHISDYYFLTGEGKQYAQLLFDKFLQGKGDPVRPFGDAILDGIELDIEKNWKAGGASDAGSTNDWQPEMIDLFVELRKLSPNVILGVVPQCYLNHWDYTDYNMGQLISSKQVKIDYLLIQYYNNPACSYPFGFNFGDWKQKYNGPIVVGLPGDPTSAVYGGFLPPNDLQAVTDAVFNDPQFGGYGVYDVSSCNPPLSTYAQTMRDALDGKKVGSGSPAPGPIPRGPEIVGRCGNPDKPALASVGPDADADFFAHAYTDCDAPSCDGNSKCPAGWNCISCTTCNKTYWETTSLALDLANNVAYLKAHPDFQPPVG